MSKGRTIPLAGILVVATTTGASAESGAAGLTSVLGTIATKLTDQLLLYTLAVCILTAVTTYLCRSNRVAALLCAGTIMAIAFGGPILLRTFFSLDTQPPPEGSFANAVRTAPVEFTMAPGDQQTLIVNCPPGMKPIGVDFDAAFPSRVRLNKGDTSANFEILNLHGQQRPPRDGWVSAICAKA